MSQPSERLQQSDQQGAVGQRPGVAQQANRETVPDGAAAHVLLVVVVIRRVVVLCHGVSHHELIQRVHETHEPKRHQRIEGQDESLRDVEPPDVNDIPAGVCLHAREQQQEAVQHGGREAGLAEGPQCRCQHQGEAHLHHCLGGDLEACRRPGGVGVEAGRHASDHGREDPHHAGQPPVHLCLATAARFPEDGNAGRRALAVPAGAPEYDPEDDQPHEREHQAKPEQGLRTAPQERQVHVPQDHSYEEGRGKRVHCLGHRGDGLHEVVRAAGQEDVDDLPPHLRVLLLVRDAVAAPGDLRAVGGHALCPTNLCASRFDPAHWSQDTPLSRLEARAGGDADRPVQVQLQTLRTI
mmetsp:Transcript_58204/g.173173  ORF Transcript_58204/g.173173 Transcript_58204/m.173173 type:complete len:353 (-) Transcript_58204:320-1378(-)